MNSESLKIVCEHEVAWVTLNRPDRLNALDPALVRALRDFFTSLYHRNDIRAVVLGGTGRAFCAGLDLQAEDAIPVSGQVTRGLDGQRGIRDIVVAMRRCPQPIVCLAQGAAAGGGLALALASDIRMATPDLRMNAAFIRVGLSACDIGVSYFLPRMVGSSVAAELMLTGRCLGAQRALSLGLVSEVGPLPQLRESVLRLVEEMLRATPLGLRMTKEVLGLAVDAASLDQVLALEDRTSDSVCTGRGFRGRHRCIPGKAGARLPFASLTLMSMNPSAGPRSNPANAQDLVLVDYPLQGCARIKLNRPAARNALSRALRLELVAAIDAVAAATSVRVLILTGAGSAFCAGLDLKELGAASEPERIELLSGHALDPVAALGRFDGPVIGAVNGPAFTGGLELALACDVLVASVAASFADTHARVGALPGWGLSQRLSRSIGIHRALELSLTGRVMTAEQAAQYGLIGSVVPADDLMAAALSMAQDMLAAQPTVLAAYKRVINDGFSRTLSEGLAVERAAADQQHAAMRSVDTLGIART